jgi:TPR repeat protein
MYKSEKFHWPRVLGRQAVRLFKEAAAKGIAESQFSVGMHYKDGTGVEQDLVQCIIYLTKAADQGHAKALFNLGLIYERGQVGPAECRCPSRSEQIRA